MITYFFHGALFACLSLSFQSLPTKKKKKTRRDFILSTKTIIFSLSNYPRKKHDGLKKTKILEIINKTMDG